LDLIKEIRIKQVWILGHLLHWFPWLGNDIRKHGWICIVCRFGHLKLFMHSSLFLLSNNPSPSSMGLLYLVPHKSLLLMRYRGKYDDYYKLSRRVLVIFCFVEVICVRVVIYDKFYAVFGWYLGFSFSVTSFFRGHRLQFHCRYGNRGIYYDCVPSSLDLCNVF
jgi:hypothetical protein